MIKATLETSDGELIALLGLSGENMARLMSDEPIMINLADLGLPTQRIVIIGGPDEHVMKARLRQYFEMRGGSIEDG